MDPNRRADTRFCSVGCRVAAHRADAKVKEFNEAMREEARQEIQAGSTCPVPPSTVQMSDAEFADWDEDTARANLRIWREAGMSEDEIEHDFAKHFTPPIVAAYYRIRHAPTQIPTHEDASAAP